MILLPIVFLAILYLSCVYINNHFEYKKAYWFFEFSHLAAGFLIALFLSNFLPNAISTVILTALVGLIWEIGEIIVDRSDRIKNMLAKLNIRQGPVTVSDTLLDLVLDTSGALILINFF